MPPSRRPSSYVTTGLVSRVGQLDFCNFSCTPVSKDKWLEKYEDVNSKLCFVISPRLNCVISVLVSFFYSVRLNS